jgi:hypothetical protein
MMNKVLKIITMLFVIAAVVFAAGCANKSTSNVTQGASEQVTPQTSVAGEGGNQSEVSANVPAETNVTETPTENATGNVTETMAENNTPTPAASGAVHLSTAARHQALIKSQQQSNSAANTTP